MAAERVPLNVVLALDMSGSVVGERLGHLRAAARLVVDALLPGEKVGLILFNAGVGVQTPLTTDVSLVRHALEAPSNGGDTALVDASYAAMTLSESATDGRWPSSSAMAQTPRVFSARRRS